MASPAAGRDGPLDSDHGQVLTDSSVPFLSMLAIGGVLGVAAAINELTSAAICEAPDQRASANYQCTHAADYL